MTRPTLLIACAALTVAAAAASAAAADPPRSRGDLMKACMAEWKVKSRQPGGEKLKYTAFLSECLKRMNAAPAPAPR